MSSSSVNSACVALTLLAKLFSCLRLQLDGCLCSCCCHAQVLPASSSLYKDAQFFRSSRSFCHFSFHRKGIEAEVQPCRHIYLCCLQPNLGGEGLISDPPSRCWGHLTELYASFSSSNKKLEPGYARKLVHIEAILSLRDLAVTANNSVRGIIRNWVGMGRWECCLTCPALA